MYFFLAMTVCFNRNISHYHQVTRQIKADSPLVDESDFGEKVRVLVYLEHSIQDASTDSSGKRRVVSRRMQYVEIDSEGNIQNAGYAPYLNYRPLREAEEGFIT